MASRAEPHAQMSMSQNLHEMVHQGGIGGKPIIVDSEKPPALEKHYRRKEVEEITGLSCSTIYDLMSKGEFPKPIKMSAKVVAWSASSLRNYITEREAVA